MSNPVFIPAAGQSAKDFLRNKMGRMFLLHVRCEGKQTTIVINIESRSSATWRWRDRKNKGAAPLNLDWPGFDLTAETMVLRDEDLNTLAATYPEVRVICTLASDTTPAEIRMEDVPMSHKQFDEFLARLEAGSDLFRKIHKDFEQPAKKSAKTSAK